MKTKIIGVMGSGRNPWTEFSVPLGRWLAVSGFHLLTGGGQGVMAAVSEAFCSVNPRRGLSLGIIPTDKPLYSLRPGYPNPHVEIPIITPLQTFDSTKSEVLTRNHINILTSDIVVALPGGLGTQNEVNLAMQFGKPIIFFGPKSFEVEPSEIRRTHDMRVVELFIQKLANSTS